MASKYDDLSATAALEQSIAADLVAACEPRGATVVHNGSATMSAPGGRADIELRDGPNGRLILVEVTRRTGSAADGEFIAIADHLDKAMDAGAYEDYGCLFVSPATSARMSANLQDRNRQRQADGKAGRFLALDFAGFELLQRTLRETDPAIYPLDRLGPLFGRWAEAIDDARTRLLIAEIVFAENVPLYQDLSDEMKRIDAEREQRLKKEIEGIENKLRDRGITGNAANTTLIYLTFLRLYEEKRNREEGRLNRFTRTGFDAWVAGVPDAIRARYPGRLTEALLHEVAEDRYLKESGLLWNGPSKQDLPANLDDAMVRDLVLPVFDEYNFYTPAVDILGVVFETLTRRGEKDTRVGQFFTPQEVVNFAAQLIDLRPTDVVLDPAVGTARFLIAAMRIEMERIATSGKPPAETERDIRARQLLGTDIDPWVATIAKMNMYVHGDGKSNMIEGNGLTLADLPLFTPFPDGLAGSVDAVLTNPPLGNTSYRVAMEHWQSRSGRAATEAAQLAFYQGLGVVPMKAPQATAEERRRSSLSARIARLSEQMSAVTGSGPKQDARRKKLAADIQSAVAAMAAIQPSASVPVRPAGERMKGGALFLGSIAAYLKRERLPGEAIEWRGGRAIVVVDEAILNTPEYGDVRAFIRRAYFIKAVVSLGRAAFQYLAHTDAKTSVLYLVRKPIDELVQREPIFFAHAEDVGYSRTGKWIGSHLPKVLIDYAAVSAAIRSSYGSDAVFRRVEAESKVAAIGGYQTEWHLGFDSGKGRDRLDFFDARYRDIISRLEQSGVELISLSTLLATRDAEHPEASRTSEYRFASIDRNTGQVRDRGVQQVTAYTTAELWIVREGDLVVSGIDTVHGAVAVAGPDVDGLVMSKEMFAFRARPEADVNLEYIAEVLRSPVARDLLFGLVSGTSNRNRLTHPGQLLSLPIPRPPARTEQDAVADRRRAAHDMRTAAHLESTKTAHRVSSTWAIYIGQSMADVDQASHEKEPAPLSVERS